MRAFLVTDAWEDRDGRHLLRFYGRTDRASGSRPVEIQIDQFRPVFFIEREAELPVDELPPHDRQPVELRNFNGEPVDALYFRGEHDLRRAREELPRHGVRTFESDVHPCERYRMERFLAGPVEITPPQNDRGESQRIPSGTGPIVLRNARMRALSAADSNRESEAAVDQVDLVVASIDIETGVASGELYSIAIHTTGGNRPDDRRVYVLQNARAKHSERITQAARGRTARDENGDEYRLHFCANETEVLQRFFRAIQNELDPDILIGWNVVGFDLKFLAQKAHSLGMAFKLGRGGRTASVRERAGAGEFATVPGRAVMDGPMVLRAAFYSFADFRLESVARELLGRGKLIAAQDSAEKIAEIDRLFQEDQEGLARYNLQDCVLVSEVFAHAGLVELWKRRSEISGMLLDQIGRSVAAFDFFLLPRLHRKGFVAISEQDVLYENPAPGGYVMEPDSGLYTDVIVLDFRSLYPSIIRSFRIDPYAHLMQRLNADEPAVVVPGGQFRFSREHHILPEFIAGLLEQRAAAKAANDGYLSMAIKILMNSFYGVMGSPGCRFYHSDLPSAITRTGQWLLLESRTFIEELGFRVIYGDTDSLFVLLGETINYSASDDSGIGEEAPESGNGTRPGDPAVVKATGDRLADELNAYWTNRLREEFGLESFLEMEYEKHFEKFCLPPARGGGAAKKRYAGLLVNGTEPPTSSEPTVSELHFAGMEIVRSDWTEAAKDFQRGLYERVFRENTAPVEWIREFCQRVRDGEFDDRLVYRKRLRKSVDEYVKNVPQHVRAAKLLDKPGSSVSYVITRHGPIPIQKTPRDIDYEYYLEHQLKPIADTVLGFFHTDFEETVYSTQLNLF